MTSVKSKTPPLRLWTPWTSEGLSLINFPSWKYYEIADLLKGHPKLTALQNAVKQFEWTGTNFMNIFSNGAANAIALKYQAAAYEQDHGASFPSEVRDWARRLCQEVLASQLKVASPLLTQNTEGESFIRGTSTNCDAQRKSEPQSPRMSLSNFSSDYARPLTQRRRRRSSISSACSSLTLDNFFPLSSQMCSGQTPSAKTNPKPLSVSGVFARPAHYHHPPMTSQRGFQGKVLVLSFTSGIERKEFADAQLGYCKRLLQKRMLFPWVMSAAPLPPEAPDNDSKRKLSHSTPADALTTRQTRHVTKLFPKPLPAVSIRFIRDPLRLEKIRFLIVAPDQFRPTRKILFALASKAYLLSDTFLKYAIKHGVWPLPQRHESSLWPTVRFRKNTFVQPPPLTVEARLLNQSKTANLFAGLYFCVIGAWDPKAIQPTDLTKLIHLCGGICRPQSLLSHCDIVIVPETLSFLPPELQKFVNTRDENDRPYPTIVTSAWLINSISAWCHPPTVDYFPPAASLTSMFYKFSDVQSLAPTEPLPTPDRDLVTTAKPRVLCGKRLSDTSCVESGAEIEVEEFAITTGPKRYLKRRKSQPQDSSLENGSNDKYPDAASATMQRSTPTA